MSAIDFFFFSAVAVFSSIASVRSARMLYAVLWQMQTAAAVSGLIACLNARFVAFSLLSSASSSFLVFLLFASVVFKTDENAPAGGRGWIFFVFTVVLPAVEFFWLFFRMLPENAGQAAAFHLSFGALGTLLYSHYAVCTATAGLILAGTAVGVTMLMSDAKKDAEEAEGSVHFKEKPDAGVRSVPVKRREV